MGSKLIVSIFNNSKEFGSMKVKAIQLALEEKMQLAAFKAEILGLVGDDAS